MKRDKILVLVVIMIGIFMAFLGIPSTSYAIGNTLTVKSFTGPLMQGKTADKYFQGISSTGEIAFSGVSGLEDDPFIISLDYDEIVFEESDIIPTPFYFQIKASQTGMYIGKYMIDMKQEENKIIFSKIGGASTPTAYAATPPRKSMGETYLQAGAVLDDNYQDMVDSIPMYKITSKEIVKKAGASSVNYSTHQFMNTTMFSAQGLTSNASVKTHPFMNEQTLGNSHLDAAQTSSTNYATYPTVFVFCASERSVGEVYATSTLQSNSFFTVKLDGTNVKITPQDLASDEIKNRTVGIVYAFHNSTSDILEREAPWLESLISRALIQIGDLFMALVQKTFGTDASIDSIIFNDYQPVIVDFFSTSEHGLYYSVMKMVINNWFKAFRIFTIIALMVVLVAMGIKTMLISHTGDMKKISNMLVGWLMAVVLLYFAPYFMKYAIQVNDVLVKLLKDNRRYSIYSIYNYDLANLNLTTITDYSKYEVIGNDYNAEYMSNTYQIGEDSETTYLEQLLALKDDLGDSYTQKQEELTTENNRLKNIRLSIRKFSPYRILIVNGSRSSNSSIAAVIRNIEKSIDSGMTPSQAVRVNVSNIIVEEKAETVDDFVTFYASPDEVRSDLMNVFHEYAASYKAKGDVESDMKKVDQAIALVEKNLDLIGTMRARAGATKRFVFVLVWFILIYQLVLLIILYYKRLLTIAVLIAIFPLVMLFYALEKLMGIEKPKVLRTWITEYTVNVFIQSVHALLYVVLIDTAISIFEADSDNWLMFVFAVMAIFPMEAIIKSIMGMKSNTVKDLKESAKQGLLYGGAAYAIYKAKGSKKDIEGRGAKAEARVDKNRAKRDAIRSLARQRRDNHTMKNALKSSPTLKKASDTLDIIKERNEKRQEKDKKRAIRRQNRTDFRRNMRRVKSGMQSVRNAQAKVGAVTSGLAAGGSAQAFAQGAAISGIFAGSTRSSSKTNASLSSDTVPKSSANTSNYANFNSPSTGSRTPGNPGARYANQNEKIHPNQANTSGPKRTPRTTKAEAKQEKKKAFNQSKIRMAQAVSQVRKDRAYDVKTNTYDEE